MNDNEPLLDHIPSADCEAIYIACAIVADADGRATTEQAVLQHIAAELKLPPATTQEIAADVHQGARRCPTPQSKAGKRLMVHYAIEVAAADGRLSGREQDIVRRLGKHLGVSRNEITTHLAATKRRAARIKRRQAKSQAAPIDTGEGEPESLTDFFEKLGSASTRTRRYEYSRWRGWLPTSHVLFVIVFMFSGIAFTIGGAAGLGSAWVLIPIALVIGVGIYDEMPFLRRRRGMRAIADKLGMSYSQTGEVTWFPPPANNHVKERKYYNVIEGPFDGEPVIAFDGCIRTRSEQSTRSPDVVSRWRRYFNVVQLHAPRGVPPLIIAKQHQSRFDSIPIPGTDYELHGDNREERERAAACLSEELIDFLASNSGLVIQVRDDRLSLYCYRWTSTRRQVPASLPALMEDAVYLQRLLHAGSKDGAQPGAITTNPGSSRGLTRLLRLLAWLAFGGFSLVGMLMLYMAALVVASLFNPQTQKHGSDVATGDTKQSVNHQPRDQHQPQKQQPPSNAKKQPNAVLARQQYQRAVLFGTPEEVRAILEAHPDANLPAMRVSGHGTGLHQAAFQGRPGVAMVLLEFGANPNATASNNQTPLHIACRRNRPKVVRLLLQYGADVKAKDSGGFTPRQRADHSKRASILRILDEYAAQSSKDVEK